MIGVTSIMRNGGMMRRSGSTNQSVRMYAGRIQRLCRPTPSHDPMTRTMRASRINWVAWYTISRAEELHDDPLRRGDHQDAAEDADPQQPPAGLLGVAPPAQQPGLDGRQHGIAEAADGLSHPAKGVDAPRADRPGAQGDAGAEDEECEDGEPKDVEGQRHSGTTLTSPGASMCISSLTWILIGLTTEGIDAISSCSWVMSSFMQWPR